MMNSMERVVTALKHKEPDRVPVYPVLGGCTRSYVGATYEEWATNADVCAEAFLKCREDLDLDCIVTLIDLSVECTAWGQELIFPENEAARQINETLKEYSAALMETGIQGIMFDTLFSSGTIMGKEMWDELEGDLVQELAELVHGMGGLVMIHNCGGNIYFDAQIARMHPDAISFLYPPQDCEDFVECKKKYGNQTTLIGCVAPTTAALGTDEEWEKECKKNIDEMAAGGGFILATGCEYPANASFDHARQMVEIAKTYGVYKK